MDDEYSHTMTIHFFSSKLKHTKNRCSAADMSLLSESFVGLISSLDDVPRYGHFITFSTDSKSLQKEQNKFSDKLRSDKIT